MDRKKVSKHKRRAGIGRRLLSGVALLGLSGVTAFGCGLEGDEQVGADVQALEEGFIEADKLQINIEGCRQATASTIVFPAPSTNGSPAGFVCEEGLGAGGTSEGLYIEGNIKFWNELDLVPFHVNLTLDDTSTTPVYNLTIIGDAAEDVQGVEVPGYDVITAPAVNSATAGNCTVSDVGVQEIKDPAVTGGALKSIVRTIQVTQTPGTVCTLDWTKRLAVGSSGFTGASLQARVATQDDFGGGDRTITIFLKDVLPQELRKDMTATQDTEFAWNITKEPTPATVSFENTCDSVPTSKQVNIRVVWSILPGTPGMVMVATNIYAKNPASRPVTVNVTDVISGDPDGDGPEMKQELATDISGDVVIPANTEILVCFDGTTTCLVSHVFDAPETVSDLMDTATATYVDALTGEDIGQTTEAMASSIIQPGTQTNTTATVTDTESISGNGLQYSADSTVFGSADGAFTVNGAPYVLGSKLDQDDFDLLWASVTQNGDTACTDPDGCDVGFVDFNKTVYVDPVPVITSGTLSDTASLTASDGFTASSGPATIGISANAEVELTLVKTIPDILQDAETITCDFEVKDSDDNVVATPQFVFTADDDTTEETTITRLAPDVYTVTEGACGGLVPSGGTTQTVDLTLPPGSTVADCVDTVTFNNIVGEGSARAEVDKVTMPAGFEDGWVMTLSGPGTNGGITLTTADSTPGAYERFQDPDLMRDFFLLEGTYTITETPQAGWQKPPASSGCSFTVNYPADFGKVFQCVYTNKKLGKIIIEKQTDPADPNGDNSFGFTDNIAAPNEFSLVDDEQEIFLDVPAGTYTVTENNPKPEFDLVDLVCVDDFDEYLYNVVDSSRDLVNREATINLDPGETVKCTYTNRQRGMVDLRKLTNGVEDPLMMWSFTLKGPEVNEGLSTPPALLEFESKLIPGETYTLCEAGIPPSWTIQWALDANGSGIIDDGETLPFVGGEADLMGDGLLQVYDPDPSYGTSSAVNDTRCVNFEVDAAQTLSFIVDNQRPGGEPRTPGYWKNWNTCTGGNQQDTAAANGGPSEGWFLADDLIPTSVGDLDIITCDDAVSILDHRDLSSGKKKANCADFNLARNLLAAKLNLAAGAETCTAVTEAVAAGDDLLSSLGFTGTNSCLRPKGQSKDDYQHANELAATLDEYNNGLLCD